jgi:hypothetical protein
VVFPVSGGAPVHLVDDVVVREHLGASKGVRHGPKKKGDTGAAELTKEGGKQRRWLRMWQF